MSAEFDQLLRAAFPASSDRAVITVISEGIGLADDIRRNTPWLLGLLGDDVRGTLRRIATMWRFQQACKEGLLPFEAGEVINTSGTAHLLQIKSDNFDAHIVRTESEGAFPRDAPIRQDARLKNQPDLFDDGKIVPLHEIHVQRMYAWLSFNADRIGHPTHICWCMPADKANKFLSRVSILRLPQGETSIPSGSPPPPDPTQKMKFRTFIDKGIENKNNEK